MVLPAELQGVRDIGAHSGLCRLLPVVLVDSEVEQYLTGNLLAILVDLLI